MMLVEEVQVPTEMYAIQFQIPSACLTRLSGFLLQLDGVVYGSADMLRGGWSLNMDGGC